VVLVTPHVSEDAVQLCRFLKDRSQVVENVDVFAEVDSMSLIKKKITVEELGNILACVSVAHGTSRINIDTKFCQSPIGFSNIDANLLKEETIYLACFAVDFATTLELGQHNPIRNAVLDVRNNHLVALTDQGQLYPDFSDKLNIRQRYYADAISSLTDSGQIVQNVGIAFVEIFGSSLGQLDLTAKAAIYWGAIVRGVRDLLQSLKIVYR